MRKLMKKFKTLTMILIMMLSFIQAPNVKAEEITDGFGLHGKSFAIISKDTFTVKNNGVTQVTHLALTDSYNEMYSESTKNSNSIGGKKVLQEDVKCDEPLTSCTVEDTGITYWTFEIDENIREAILNDTGNKNRDKYDTLGNQSSTLGGYFKWYNIYTIDNSGNKKYLNLSFGEKTEHKIEISTTPVPVAVTKLDNGAGYVIWGKENHLAYWDKNYPQNVLTQAQDFNNGTFTPGTAYKQNDNNYIYVLAQPGYEEKTLSSIPNVVKNTTNFNAKISLYNYSKEINAQGAGINGFKFYNGNNSDTPLQITTDGYGMSYSRARTGAIVDYNVDPLLDENGYPTTSLGSLAYLFNEQKVTGKTTAGRGIDGSSLFQVDDKGYYYYDSAKNAAYYDGGKFILYDAIVRPEYALITGMSSSGKVDYTADDRKGNFLPFNKVNAATLSPYETAQTSDGTTSYKLNGQTASESVPDLWFGLTIENDFYMPKDGLVEGEDMTFSFNGDDTVLTYIDGALVVDYTGDGSAYINFKTGEVVDSKHAAGERTVAQILTDAGIDSSYIKGNSLNPDVKHEMKVFYIERGGNLSTFNMKMNLLETPEVVNPNTGVNYTIIIVTLLILGASLVLVSKKVSKTKRIN